MDKTRYIEVRLGEWEEHKSKSKHLPDLRKKRDDRNRTQKIVIKARPTQST